MTEQTFTIGITMAGAVSAGAYTAGVLDYLFRALDSHAARVARGRSESDPTLPKHNVVVKVMSGASAGGVCAGMAIAALANAQRQGPIEIGERFLKEAVTRQVLLDDETTQDVTYALSTLYDVWVEGLDLWKPHAQAGLLSLDDLRDHQVALRSALNSNHIDDVAARALEDIRWGGAANAGLAYPFFTTDLDLFLTTTNLQGVPYKVKFATNEGEFAHRMAQHSAVRHFRVTGFGTWEAPSKWLEDWNDHGVPLPLETLEDGRIPFDDTASNWARLKAASFATGAFPIALSARQIDVTAQDFAQFDDSVPARGGALPLDIHPGLLRSAKPDFGSDVSGNTSVSYTAVDGGVANNEPFEYARFTLRDGEEMAKAESHGEHSPRVQGYLKPNPRDPDKADRAVIMIDPFPEGPDFVPLDPDDPVARGDLISCLKSLFPALINQARFKPGELANAGQTSVRSRFIISPSREQGGRSITGAAAIACGGFSGFGGFIDEPFRLHDFILGQRNCQRFLKEYFTLAETNPIFYPGGQVPDEAKPDTYRPIIDPGPELADTEIAPMIWPGVSAERLDLVLRQAKRRLEKVGARALAGLMQNWLAARAINVAWILKWKDLRLAIVRMVMCDLIRRDQHASYQNKSTESKSAVIALIARGDHPATAEELMADVQAAGGKPFASAADLERELRQLADTGQVWSVTSLGGKRRFLYALFKPGTVGTMRLRILGA